MNGDVERKVAQLEISVKDIDNRLTALHREQAALIMELKNVKQKETKDHSAEMRELKASVEELKSDTEKKITEFKNVKQKETKDHSAEIRELKASVDELKGGTEKKITDLKKHANSVLDEIYDSVDELKKVKKAETKMEQVKPIDLKPLEERLVEFDKKMSAVTEALKILNNKITNGGSSDIEKLRLEMESMKEQNVPTLIKDLSLETQKLNNKFFVIEDSIKALQKKIGEDN